MESFDHRTDTPEDDGTDDFTPLPEGWYHASIIGSEDAEPTDPNSKAGTMLKLQVEIDPNEHPDVGRRSFFTRLCIQHQSTKPRNIARRHLSAICQAIELAPMTSAAELLGAAIMVKLKFKPAETRNGKSFKADNEIADFAARGNEKTNEAPKRDSQARPDSAAEPAAEQAAPKREAAKPGAWKR